MLNGVDPILIFHFYNKDSSSFLAGLGVPDSISNAAGIPVPIYLSEAQTGIYVTSETGGLDIQTEVEPVVEKDPITQETAAPKINQKALDSTVTINMIAKRDSILLTALLASANLILKKIVSKEYGITYLNKTTVIFGGLLNRFQTTINENDDLVRIELVISTSQQNNTKTPTGPAPIPVKTGTVPL